MNNLPFPRPNHFLRVGSLMIGPFRRVRTKGVEEWTYGRCSYRRIWGPIWQRCPRDFFAEYGHILQDLLQKAQQHVRDFPRVQRKTREYQMAVHRWEVLKELSDRLEKLKG